MIKVKSLSECREFVSIAAHWAYGEWYISRSIDFFLVLKSYQLRASEERGEISRCKIAFIDGFPVGMVSLKENDLWSRKDLNPWLASLYVHPYFRKRGVGERLINELIDSVNSQSFIRLYLFLDHRERVQLEQYYIKRGWQYFDEGFDNDGNETKIYFYDLTKT